MSLIQLIKWAWQDAKDDTHSCLNEYSYEKGDNKLTLFMPKDEYFEKKSFESLSKVYGCGLKKILVDLLIPNSKGHTTQLDIVFINRSGIYVVECKNYSCYIEGGNIDKWTRKEFNGKVNKVENPIIQNTNHIKCLSKLLDYPEEYFFNIVTFADTCKLYYTDDSELPYETNVVNHRDIKSTIRTITKSHEEVFSDDEIYDIYNELSKYARYSYHDRIKHLEYVNSLQN